MSKIESINKLLLIKEIEIFEKRAKSCNLALQIFNLKKQINQIKKNKQY